MYFLTEDEKLLKKYNNVRNKVINSMKTEFDSKLIYNEKFLKTKLKSSGDEATDFHDKEILKRDSNYTCLAVILIDFILKKRRKLLSAKVLKRMFIH